MMKLVFFEVSPTHTCSPSIPAVVHVYRSYIGYELLNLSDALSVPLVALYTRPVPFLYAWWMDERSDGMTLTRASQTVYCRLRYAIVAATSCRIQSCVSYCVVGGCTISLLARGYYTANFLFTLLNMQASFTSSYRTIQNHVHPAKCKGKKKPIYFSYCTHIRHAR